MIDKKTLKAAAKASVPVFLGYFPTGFAFGLMLTSAGYSWVLAVIMSVVIYAGAGQYLAVALFTANAGLFQVAIMTFLVNSKHLFYGLSLLGDYGSAGWRKPYLMFSLTDEVYALLTKPGADPGVDRAKYCFYVSALTHCAWIASALLGGLLGAFARFDVTGLDFAMTALFIVILIEQLKVYKTKLPFIIGSVCAVAALLLVGRSNVLIGGSLLSGALMLVFRKGIVRRDV